MKTLSIPQNLFRSATFERESINETERTVEMTVSSEEPYERYWGVEVLDHKTKSLRMDRFKKAAPLLFNHDRNLHLGRIVSSKVADGKLIVTAKFSNSQFAKEKWEDVKDGILRETSIGYSIYAMRLESEKDGVDTYRVTDWEPYESSLVTVPADCTVGVGRSAEAENTKEIVLNDVKQVDNKSLTFNKSHMSEPTAPVTAPTINVVHERNEAVANERKRMSEIQDLSLHFAEKGLGGRKVDTSAIAAECIREGRSLADFQSACLRAELPEVKPLQVADKLDLSSKEQRTYSLSRVIQTRLAGREIDGLEKECHDELAKRGIEAPSGVLLPTADLLIDKRAAMRGASFFGRRDMTVGVAADGGNLVATELLGGSMIELLRNKMVLKRLGAITLDGLTSNIAIPRHTTAVTEDSVSEQGAPTESTPAVGQLSLSPKRVSGFTDYSRQLLIQGSIDVENFLRMDLMTVMAIKWDYLGINGSGSANQPRGILNTSGIGSVTFGGAAVWDDMLDFEQDVADANAEAGALAYLTTNAARRKLKAKTKIDSSQYSDFIWEKPTGFPGALPGDGVINSYLAVATLQVASDKMIFGNFRDLIIAGFGAPDLIVDPFTRATEGTNRITINQFGDIGVRHAGSFSASTDSAAQ